MATSYTIVAIPSVDDYVWRISSEKVPHLTLLFLGDSLTNLDRVTDYLGHAADTSLRRFGLEVDHRGVLGPEDADVVFFGKYGLRPLEAFRASLLVNDDINKAYNATQQFDKWVPHLTLGYPATPAKEDDRDYPGITWVNFDRVALWSDNYEGPEFELKSYDSLAEVSMSSIPNRPDEALAHFGVKGMHWGVHKNIKVSEADVEKIQGIRAGKSQTKQKFKGEVNKAGGLHKVSDKDLQSMLNRLDMERRYNSILNEDAKKRREGGKTIGKILLEVGKIAVPLIVGGLTAKAAADHGVFRTSATVGKPTIDAVKKALGS